LCVWQVIAYQIKLAGEAGDLVKADSLPAQLDKQFEVLKNTKSIILGFINI